MNRTGRSEDRFEPFAQEQAEVALLHLARRLAERQLQSVSAIVSQRQQMVMENEFNGDQFQRFLLEVQRGWVNEFELVRLRQGAPSIFLRGKVQVHNRAVLRQVETALSAADLFKLLFGEFTLLE